MRNWLLALVCMPLVIVGCSQLPMRVRPAHPGSPNQVAPSTPGEPLAPIPDLGPASPVVPDGPMLEGPVFPDSAGRSRPPKAFVRPASSARHAPLRGYIELPPSP